MSKHPRRHPSLRRAALGATTLTAALGATAVAGPASTGPVCTTTDLCVHDSRGTPVGPIVQTGLLIHEFHGNFYSLAVDRDGLQVNSFFFYTGANCDSAPLQSTYWDATTEPTMAQFDGTNVWTAALATEDVLINSYGGSYRVAGTQEIYTYCNNETFRSTVSQPILLDSTIARSYLPPFSVRRF